MQMSYLYASDFSSLFFSETSANSLNRKKQRGKKCSEKINDSYSLIKVQTTIIHISVCFLPRQIIFFMFRARAEKGIARHIDVSSDYIRKKLEDDLSLHSRTNLDIEDIISLLNFVLSNNFFVYNDTIYKQIHGCAMGSLVNNSCPLLRQYHILLKKH